MNQQAAKTILSSMEIICRSRIQKRLNISRRFEQILRGGISPTLEDEPLVDPNTAPTKANIRHLNMQNKLPNNKAKVYAGEEFNESATAIAVRESKTVSVQASKPVPLRLQLSPSFFVSFVVLFYFPLCILRMCV